MFVFLNGDFLPEEQATVSVFDRCFLYGDGLFETMRVFAGKPYCWEQHWARLEAGSKFLGIALPSAGSETQATALELAHRNGLKDAVLRLTVSRGVGKRGYSPRGAHNPAIVMSVHTSPDLHQENLRPWSLVTSSVRLRSDEPLAAFKTCNRLPQIIARGEAEEARADEALLANSEGWVVEGAASNLFWIQNGIVHTPPLESGILPGITRAVLLELCQQLRMETRQTNLTGEQLRETEGVFLSLSSIGIAEAVSLDGKALRQSAITQRLHAAYVQRLRQQSAKV